MASFLRKIGWREIDSDAIGRESETDRRERCPHAVAAFTDCLVGKTYDSKGGIAAAGDAHLHVHLARFDALKGDGIDARHRHGPFPEVPSGPIFSRDYRDSVSGLYRSFAIIVFDAEIYNGQ